MANATTTAPAQPVASFRFGNVSAAIFTRNVKTKGGDDLATESVSLRRSYRNASGEWENTHTLRNADLLPASLALMKAYEFIQDARGASDEK